MTITELLSPGSIIIRSESFLDIEKMLRSSHMWCDVRDSVTHFGAMAAAVARADAFCQKGSQSPVIARAAVAVAFITLHHSLKR